MNKHSCVHYTRGIALKMLEESNTKCAAGVHFYSKFDSSKPGILLRMPCSGTNTEGVIYCDKIKHPTDDDLLKHEMQKAMEGIQVVGKWKVKGVPKKSRFETIKCPLCSGRLNLAQNNVNGHAAGQCETTDCIRFVE